MSKWWDFVIAVVALMISVAVVSLIVGRPPEANYIFGVSLGAFLVTIIRD